MALTPLANAQQFQTPTLPGQPAPAVSLEVQARLQHAEALKSQMLRAQLEQGAPSEFAVKAYEAQQAYQAQRAFDEYVAYLAKQKQLEQEQRGQSPANQFSTSQSVVNSTTGTVSAAFQIPSNRATLPVETTAGYSGSPTQIPNQPSTYLPPVHISPTVAPPQISLGDQPKIQQSPSYQPQPNHSQPIANAVVSQQFAYQTPSPQAPAQSRYAFQPRQATGYPPTQPYVQPRRQLATPQRMISPGNLNTMPANARQASTGNSSRSQPNDRRPQYILQENGYEGLQDRISSLLSKPRYRDANSSPGRPFQSASRSQIAARPTSRDSRSAQPRTWLAQTRPGSQPLPYAGRSGAQPPHPQAGAAANPGLQSAQIQSSRLPTPAMRQRQDAEVRYAFEMQQRTEPSNQNRRAVQQVMMVEPAQDPFNDQSVELPPSSNLTLQAPQEFSQPAPPDRQALAIPLVDENTPARQISVLDNGSQEEGQDNQFGQTLPLRSDATQQADQGFQPPANNAFTQQEPSGLPPLDNQGNSNAEFERRVQELENELENKDSIVDNVMAPDVGQSLGVGGQRIVSNMKNCDDFRNQLLQGSIRDIPLDMSPLASRNRSQNDAISRNWTDRAGNIVATGKMVDLRRGYVIIDGVDGRQKISYAKLSDADWAVISKYWSIPELCSVGNQGDATRSWTPQTFTWKASSLCHKPLFFENVQLERYGHTHGPVVQPIRSVAHFFVSFVTVPYQSGIHPWTECEYALGFYRPGDCAPWLKDPIPFSLNGAARQAIITTGVAVIP